MELLSRPRTWVNGFLLVTLAALACGWFLGVSPYLEEKRVAEEQLRSAQSLNATYEAALAELEADSSFLPGYQAEVAALQGSLPRDEDLEEFLAILYLAERSAGVSIRQSSFDPVQIFVSAIPEASSTLVTSENLLVIPVRVTFTADNGGDAMRFVSTLQQAPRLVILPNFTLTSGGGFDGGVNGTLNGYIFVLRDPRTPEQIAAAEGIQVIDLSEVEPVEVEDGSGEEVDAEADTEDEAATDDAETTD